MPIYEYRCEQCGEFEHTQRITDPALQRCPKCKRKVRRLISSTSFQLKGSGWYVTDYARAGSGKDKDQEKKDGPKDASGDTASAASSSDGAGKTAGTASESPKSDSPKAESNKSESNKSESKKSAGSKKADKPARASA
jgi:putative FmdB family regulatory protein